MSSPAKTSPRKSQVASRAGSPSSRREALANFFKPRGVVIIGSVDTSPFQRERNKRFGCPFCYVNPRGGDAGEFAVYKTVSEVPDPVDLAIVKVAASRTPEIVEECARRGIRNLVIFSNGFSEIGGVGHEYERKLVEAIERTGVLAIGPNTNENAFEKLPIPEGHRGGLIGLVTQSGFQGRAIVEGTALGAGFTRWVPMGNEAGLEASDMIEYFADDPNTAAIAGYIEGFKSGSKLRAALQIANQRKKPVVVLKMGSTARGASMAASHTGHLAGGDAAVSGLLTQHGVTRVRDLDELLETVNLFAKVPAGTGPRCALYSVSGGTVTLMSEVAETYGVPTPELTPKTVAALTAMMPPYLRVSNPIDNGGSFLNTASEETRLEALDLIANDPNIDIVVIGVGGAYPGLADPFASDLMKWAHRAKKPVVATFNSPMMNSRAFEYTLKSGVPIFRSFRGCFQALAAFEAYRVRSKTFRVRPSLARKLTGEQQKLLAKPGIVAAGDATQLLTKAGVVLAKEVLVQTASAARKAARSIGCPVAMKLMSPDFPHKSDVGLVKIGIADAASAEATFKALMARAMKLNRKATIDGVLIQEQVGSGVEMIVGLSRDAQMGTTLTIGSGGIYAEILKDVAVRPLPVDEQDVREMIAGLKMAPLLAGARGAKPANVNALVKLALKVAALAESAEGLIAELDLNPVIVLPDRAVAVDALLVAGSKI